MNLDTFTRAYLVCALWATNDESTPQGGEPLDRNYGLGDFAPEAMAQAVADCARFQTENVETLSQSELDAAQAGHDFFLNRNGHGSGFWDEGTLGTPQRAACDALSDACAAFGTCEPYAGDDGRLYFA